MSRRAGLALLFILLAVAGAYAYLPLNLSELAASRTPALLADYAGRFWPPALPGGQWAGLLNATVETLAMSAIGTLAAALLGLTLALPASGRWGRSALAISRLLLNALRAIPELVWAMLMVLAAGLGPNAGTLALALHTAGVLGRLFAEALENTPSSSADALRMAGASRLQAFAYGTLPNLWPQLLAYTLYRWENNIRMASVLGFVGAGGLGQMLYVHLSLFQESHASAVILAMLLLVIGVDGLSQWLRQRWVIH